AVAAVRLVLDDAQAGDLGLELAQDGVRAVGRAVVHDDDLVRDAERLEESVGPAHEVADRRSIVVAGEEQGERPHRERIARDAEGFGDVAREAVGTRPCLRPAHGMNLIMKTWSAKARRSAAKHTSAATRTGIGHRTRRTPVATKMGKQLEV